MYDYFEFNKQIVFEMEYCPDGDLSDYLNK